MEEASLEKNEENQENQIYNYKKIFSKEYYNKNFNENNLEEFEIKTISRTKKSKKKNTQKQIEDILITEKSEIVFDYDWNKHSADKLKNHKLSLEQKKELLNEIRFSFVSHSYLFEVSKESILSQFTDLILQGISHKLSKYEDSNIEYSINCEPRNIYLIPNQDSYISSNYK